MTMQRPMLGTGTLTTKLIFSDQVGFIEARIRFMVFVFTVAVFLALC